jgi:long-chain acyl-CoA synthetase
VIKQFEKKTKAVIFEGYGMTETSPVITLNPTNLEQRKIGSVGLPFVGVDIKILDVETGLQELPQNQDGEIAASGPPIMLGYWNKPEANKTSFREIDGQRYLLTGDIGHMDEEGFVIITDRKKDMIIVGGFNVYPRDVEEVLYSHPKVALAAVVGILIPTQAKEEGFRPVETGNEGQKEILEFCKDKISGYSTQSDRVRKSAHFLNRKSPAPCLERGRTQKAQDCMSRESRGSVYFIFSQSSVISWM